jgi:YQGE family putative transporter
MLSREEKYLIFIQVIATFASAIAGIFLQIYIFRLSGFSGTVFFNLFLFISLLGTYLFSGFLLRKHTTHLLIGSSFIINILGYLLIILLQANAVNYLAVIGLIFGVSAGNFWSGFNLSQYILTNQHSRNTYFGKSLSYIQIASALGPIFGGITVIIVNYLTKNTYTGYYFLFLVVVLINLFLFANTRKLPAYTGIQFSLKDLINHQRSKKWKIVLGQNFVGGLYDAAFNTIFAILLFLILKNESLIGSVRTGMLLFVALTSIVGAKLLAKHSWLYITGALGTALSIVIFAIFQNWIGIFLFALINGLATPFFSIPLSLAILNTIDENPLPWQKKYHMLLERDGILGFARIISYILLLIFFSIYNKDDVAKNWMIAIAIFPLITGFLLYRQYKIK